MSRANRTHATRTSASRTSVDRTSAARTGANRAQAERTKAERTKTGRTDTNRRPANGSAVNGTSTNSAAGEPSAERFDRAYYERFYGHARTRVATPASTARLAHFVCSYLKHLGQPVRTVLDLGCGLGLWRPILTRQFPRARYTGVEVSPYLCRTHGWRRGSVVDFRARAAADLVVCQGVLQYLTAADARRAIANLARLCAGALYLEVLTTEDWEQNCDTAVTDGDVHLRPAAWYRRELAKHFTSCGGGVFLAEESPVVLFELEKG